MQVIIDVWLMKMEVIEEVFKMRGRVLEANSNLTSKNHLDH